MNKNELEKYLNNYKIPTKEWGVGASKTIGHLVKEINVGESIIEESGENLLRKEKGIAINLFYHDGKNLLKLFETKQIFKDGRTRERELATSVGEKMIPGETPIETVERAFKEELGIKISQRIIKDIKFVIADNEPVASKAFPGLLTKRLFYIADIFLPKKFYKPEGYIEKQSDKTTFFEWKKVE